MRLFKRSANYKVVAILSVIFVLVCLFAYKYIQKYAVEQESMRITYEELIIMDEAQVSQHCGLFKWNRLCPEYCQWDKKAKSQHCGIDLGAFNAAQASYEEYLKYLVDKGSITIGEVAKNESTGIAGKVISLNPKGLKDVSEESVLIQAIQDDPSYIQHLENPTEAVQLMAVKKNGCMIQYIKNPSVATLGEALKTCPTALKLLKNLTDEQIKLGIKSHPEGIEYLESPGDELMALAFNNGYFSEEIAHIDEENMKILPQILRKMAPSLTDDELMTSAMQNYSPNLLPTSKEVYVEEKIRLATKRNISILKKSATLYPDLLEEESFIRKVIDEPETVLKELGEPYDTNKLMELIFINPYIIKYINNPTEEMQILAVYLELNTYQYIKNPSEKLKMFGYEGTYCDRQYPEAANLPDDSIWVDGFIDFRGNMPKKEAMKLIKEYGMRLLDEGTITDYGLQFYVSVQKNKGEYLQCKLGDVTSHYQWLQVML